MSVLNRQEFITEFNHIMRDHGGCEDPDHPLWEAEKFSTTQVQCQYFVCVKPIVFDGWEKHTYWDWVNTTLQGDVTCYSSDDRERQEWWGFTKEEDVPIWILKWAK
jgi:hypothetical protein